MNRLIENFRTLFASSANSDDGLAPAAAFAAEQVNWAEPLNRHEAARNPVVDAYLASACASAGPTGSITNALAESLMAVAHRLMWRARDADNEPEADVRVFSRRFTAVTVIGADGILRSDKVKAGFSLQGPDTYYPPHAHQAEESYWVIGGDGDWKVDTRPWFAVTPGDTIYHASRARHAMQTNERPLLSVWLWTSHLDSEVLIVRGSS